MTDTETASLKGGVCDLAVVVLNDGFEIVEQYESMIDPEVPISPEASGVHHIVDEMVYDKPTLSEYMEMIGNPFDYEDLVVSGHNIQFDCRILADVLPKDYRKACTLRLARNLWPEADNHQLQTLRYRYRLEAGPAHRAMGDVITCVSLIRMVAAERGLDLAGMVELMTQPLSLDTKMPFGKHKGLKLREVPMSYVRWLLGQPEVDAELRAAFQMRL